VEVEVLQVMEEVEEEQEDIEHHSQVEQN